MARTRMDVRPIITGDSADSCSMHRRPSRTWPTQAELRQMCRRAFSIGRTSVTSGTKCLSRFWMPCCSVAVEDGQPEQEPFIERNTTPSLKPRKVMSPPSLATAGRTRVSISSLMVRPSRCRRRRRIRRRIGGGGAVCPSRRSGAPDMKCSMIAPRISGLSCCHSPSVLVTVMKSEPKNTPPTLAISNSFSASGDLRRLRRGRACRACRCRARCGRAGISGSRDWASLRSG